MKTIIITFLAFWLSFQPGHTQKLYEKKISDVKKVLIEKIPGTLLIKQSTDNLFRIETDTQREKVTDDRAKGLKPVTENYDNTGLGLALIQSGSNVTISGSNQFDNHINYTIFLPPGLEVSVDFANPFGGKLIEITDLSNPIEAKTISGQIKFSNITGPAVFHSISGNIEGSFSTFSKEGPSSITSVSGLIDVALPLQTPAEVNLISVSGKIFSGFEIDHEKFEKKDDRRAQNLSRLSGIGQKINGKINGGGNRLMIQSISGNIYLRTK